MCGPVGHTFKPQPQPHSVTKGKFPWEEVPGVRWHPVAEADTQGADSWKHATQQGCKYLTERGLSPISTRDPKSLMLLLNL